jgi:poly(3-hydroxybutyrate) depolymerase
MRLSIRRLLIAVVVMLVMGAQSAAGETCTGTPGPSGQVDLTIGGAMRMFVVRLPAKYDARTPAPVVFLFHPFGMNTQYMQGRVPIPRLARGHLDLRPGMPRGRCGPRLRG